MNYQMLVLDIDGTLTTSEKTISPATQEALLSLQKDGIYVVLASGRPTAGILPYARALKLHEFGNYILSYNGARILNLKTNEIIYDKTLPANVIPLLYEEAISSNTGLISYEGDDAIAATPIDKYMEYEACINRIPIR
ncbi:MAG: HAD-IIB family hydrolase, partial [Lachnospiraceae bacterium]|nr:HAD-IIB family hydrolase [Lachnospiraceae bacterium]